jgi:outer membrane lipoprotein-sorting protein
VGIHPLIRAPLIRRGASLAAAVLTVTGLVISAGAAGAAPQPTVSQVQAKLNKLTAKENWLI